MRRFIGQQGGPSNKRPKVSGGQTKMGDFFHGGDQKRKEREYKTAMFEGEIQAAAVSHSSAPFCDSLGSKKQRLHSKVANVARAQSMQRGLSSLKLHVPPAELKQTVCCEHIHTKVADIIFFSECPSQREVVFAWRIRAVKPAS